MELRHYMTCFWPGMPELWWRGRLSALPAAVGFATALNVLLIARFLYPEWFNGFLVHFALWIGIASWLVWSVRSIKELPQLLTPRTVSTEPDHFAEARDAYLSGQWEDAEGLLADMLAIESRDPPALLLLAGVYRHTGRLEAAETLLEEISRLEAADTWWMELRAEANRLKRAIDHAAEETTDNEAEQNTKASPTPSPTQNSDTNVEPDPTNQPETATANSNDNSTGKQTTSETEDEPKSTSTAASDLASDAAKSATSSAMADGADSRSLDRPSIDGDAVERKAKSEPNHQDSKPPKNKSLKNSESDTPLDDTVTVTAEEIDRLLSDSSF